ncbi:MAG: hypothetical protein JWP10_1452 [Nocardioidaceae bacterium]|nr:hypothetical protein [Nocardioidaceae bacterium]
MSDEPQVEPPFEAETPAWVETGVEPVDKALALLEVLETLDIHEHPQVYDAVHAGLRDALAHAGQPTGSETPPR